MRLLLDTCTFLWYVTASDRLSLRARDLLRDPGNDAYLSAVSVAEIALKTGLGHLRMAESPEIWV
ncbi:MAG TPA: type II toxin-antitoxin system VapC family toxin, partial [Thermoanaerobaculia bacterium]|nr:type II toxin-antitoxin system VapC family toxin [Thermoanaerobaculia bacterium]